MHTRHCCADRRCLVEPMHCSLTRMVETPQIDNSGCNDRIVEICYIMSRLIHSSQRCHPGHALSPLVGGTRCVSRRAKPSTSSNSGSRAETLPSCASSSDAGASVSVCALVKARFVGSSMLLARRADPPTSSGSFSSGGSQPGATLRRASRFKRAFSASRCFRYATRRSWSSANCFKRSACDRCGGSGTRTCFSRV